MTLSKGKIAPLLLLAAGIAGMGFGFASHRLPAVQVTEMTCEESPQTQPAADPAVADKKEAKEVVEVRGRVLDLNGKPVAGAKLYLSSREKEATYPIRATSDGDGRFTFRYPLTGSSGRDSAGKAPVMRQSPL